MKTPLGDDGRLDSASCSRSNRNTLEPRFRLDREQKFMKLYRSSFFKKRVSDEVRLKAVEAKAGSSLDQAGMLLFSSNANR